jgi:hypothetical protein
MKPALFVLATVVAAPIWLAEPKETFDGTTGFPVGWITGITGSGSAKWEVVADSSAPSKPNVLRQSGEATFAWAVKSHHPIQNGFVEVEIKPVSGREDQAGGIVWRSLLWGKMTLRSFVRIVKIPGQVGTSLSSIVGLRWKLNVRKNCDASKMALAP